MRKKLKQTKGIVNQTSDGENIFDSKILEERPLINYTVAKRSFIKAAKPPTNGNFQPPGGNSETAKTLKKTF